MNEKLGPWLASILAMAALLLFIFGEGSRAMALGFACLGAGVLILILDDNPPTP